MREAIMEKMKVLGRSLPEKKRKNERETWNEIEQRKMKYQFEAQRRKEK